jgi:Mn-dependent DtxR family transcriptional regulator
VVKYADSVGVKRPSVTRAISTLAILGLVKRKHYGGIEPTSSEVDFARPSHLKEV